jgi:catechol 2,3-dioxygenase-like lactoylglutathione lyase family enzyme
MVPELTVSDFDESLAFYTRGVGFDVAFSRAEPAFAYLDLEGAQLMISEFHEDGWNVGELTRPYGRGINLQIECSDVEGLREDLARSSYPLYRGIEEAWYETGDVLSGQREFLVQDPDGYLLRFSEFLGERDKTTHRADLERGRGV